MIHTTNIYAVKSATRSEGYTLNVPYAYSCPDLDRLWSETLTHPTTLLREWYTLLGCMMYASCEHFPVVLWPGLWVLQSTSIPDTSLRSCSYVDECGSHSDTRSFLCTWHSYMASPFTLFWLVLLIQLHLLQWTPFTGQITMIVKLDRPRYKHWI